MTNHHQLTQEWQEVASGACLIEATKGAAQIHFGAQAPEADSKACHIIGGVSQPSLSYGGTLKAWARSGSIGAEIVVTGAV